MRKLVRPFRLVQPPRHLAHLVASRSYLSYDKSELKDKLERNPFSYLQVINPDTKREVKGSRGTKPFFRAVRDEYDEFLAKGWLEGVSPMVEVLLKNNSVYHVNGLYQAKTVSKWASLGVTPVKGGPYLRKNSKATNKISVTSPQPGTKNRNCSISLKSR